jgi:hypothetical protein
VQRQVVNIEIFATFRVWGMLYRVNVHSRKRGADCQKHENESSVILTNVAIRRPLECTMFLLKYPRKRGIAMAS